MKRSELTKLFNDTDVNLQFGNGYVNFYLDNHCNCEFYGGNFDGGNGYDYLTATYTMDSKRPRELNFELPIDAESLKYAVMKILDIGRKPKKKRSAK